MAAYLSHSSPRGCLSDLAPSRRFGGCCGFVGPFPPPLSMSHYTIVHILIEPPFGVKFVRRKGGKAKQGGKPTLFRQSLVYGVLLGGQGRTDQRRLGYGNTSCWRAAGSPGQ
jgi:hypothetical protein